MKTLAALILLAGVAPADVTGVLGLTRGSGIQVTPDEERTLISKEIDGARWAIARPQRWRIWRCSLQHLPA